MPSYMLRKVNPFTVTKAVDLSDEEIQKLWVDIASDDGEVIFKPTSPVPLLLLGGKGSGKTHWMRYYSYPLQHLRHQRDGVAPLDGLARDRYLGIYVLLGGLNAERFRNRRQSDEVWRDVFAYYFELWIAQELLNIVAAISGEAPELRAAENQICAAIVRLIDDPPDIQLNTFIDLLNWCAGAQRQIDNAINNVLFQPRFEVRICITPGRFIFGIPKILARHIAALGKVIFAYQLDEFENMSEQQQKHINTLLRERQPPSTFRIGGRSWGVKTYKTFADDEENKEGSEFETKILDQRLRQNKAKWNRFAYRLVARRFEVSGGMDNAAEIADRDLESIFESPDLIWRSQYIFRRIDSPDAGQGPHFDRIRTRLELGLKSGAAPGLKHLSDIRVVLELLAVPGLPILEKINMLLLFQAWFRGAPLVEAARKISRQCRIFQDTPRKVPEYVRAVQHYGSDMLAQLLRDAGKRQVLYYGMGNFARMSKGLPRTLMVILKQTFDWSIYDARRDYIDRISTLDQERGVLEAADWFMETMRKAGHEGAAIRTGIERLARLFESNRFADKPIECSLLGFSVRERTLQPVTLQRLIEAEQRSFLIRVQHGEIDRNTQERLAKFQLNAVLAPKWSLPVARRGIARFRAADVDMLFDLEREAEFEAFLRTWQERMTAPYFGRRLVAASGPDLFETRE